MTAQPNPTVARRRLAVFFKSLREQRKRAQDEVARHLGVALSQASRLDTGARGYKLEDVRKLASWYGLDEATENSLLALADESRRRAWWQQVDLPDSYRTLIGMEQAATTINEYCSSVIPGLLQTREFAEAAVRASAVDVSEERVRLAVDVRLRRQKILDRDSPPNLRVVLDEAALARTTGGPNVMRAQLQHLLNMSDRRSVRIQVISFDYGIHPGSDKQMILLEMSESLPDIAYSDQSSGPDDTTDEVTVTRYRRIWDELTSVALNPRASQQLVAVYIDRISTMQ